MFDWVLVNCLLNAFAICVGEVNVFSLKVIVLCCWLIRVLSCKDYVCCVCDPSVCLDVPSICQICVYMRDVISEFLCFIFVVCVLEVVCMWSV